MTDKERIRAEVERLHEEYRGKKGDADIRRALRTVLFFIDSLQEESVSEDLEKIFDKYSEELESDYSNDMFDRGDIFIACKFGAKWQAIHSLETIKEMEEQAFLAGVEAEQINKSFSKEELLNRWRNKI